jgi:ATP-dependent RNA helicase UAP56/SUB2
MSSNDNEDLIDYEDDHDVPNGAAASIGAAGAADGEGDKEKKNFSGIHATGFRYEKNHKSVYLRSRLFIIGTFC